LEKLMTREYPRYERARVQAFPEQVVRAVARLYRVQVEGLMKGKRGGREGEENETRKVAMYLVRRCCDRTLQETARLFGVGSYGAVGWACHEIESKVQAQKKLRKQVDKLTASIIQQKT
jgi:chromosomal replication initiation ATPase DnaA